MTLLTAWTVPPEAQIPCRRSHQFPASFVCCFVLASSVVLCVSMPCGAQPYETSPIRLDTDNPVAVESFLEAMLSPEEFNERRFEVESTGDEAMFALDAVLAASKPTVQVHPERVRSIQIAGLKLAIEGRPLSLSPAPQLTDEVLDAGFRIRWTLKADGQRFSPEPHFVAHAVAAVLLPKEGNTLLAQRIETEKSAACRPNAPADLPRCRIDIGREVRAASLSPDGNRLSLAFGGLRPRIEVYDVEHTPKLMWQALFPKGSGGAVETAFSSDGEWVTALTGRGEIHRFDSARGGRHMSVPSSGRTALAVPPGRIMAVAGTNGEVTLWYLADGTIARKFPPRSSRGSVDRLAASGNGEVIATLEYADNKSVLRAWDISTRRLLRQIELPGREVSAVALNGPGDKVFISHETRGLLVASLGFKDPLTPVQGKLAPDCVGRIEWIPSRDALVCSQKKGLILLNESGELQDQWRVDEAASDWVAAAASGGSKLAAAGGGRLMIWIR